MSFHMPSKFSRNWWRMRWISGFIALMVRAENDLSTLGQRVSLACHDALKNNAII